MDSSYPRQKLTASRGGRLVLAVLPGTLPGVRRAPLRVCPLPAVVVAVAEAAFTRSQLPASTSGRPSALLVGASAAALSAVRAALFGHWSSRQSAPVARGLV